MTAVVWMYIWLALSSAAALLLVDIKLMPGQVLTASDSGCLSACAVVLQVHLTQCSQQVLAGLDTFSEAIAAAPGQPMRLAFLGLCHAHRCSTQPKEQHRNDAHC